MRKRVYVKVKQSIKSATQRLQNPPISIESPFDWDSLNTDAATRAKWEALHPQSMGENCTNINIDAIDGTTYFSMALTDAEISRLPKTDPPNLETRVAGEIDPDTGEKYPLWQFNVEDKDPDTGAPLGTYHLVDMTVMNGGP